MIENWRDGRRQLARDAYDLSGVDILLNTLVEFVVLEDHNGQRVATGVKIADGRTIFATKEVIISAGVFRSAQLLMLSGIGPDAELSRHGIPVIVNSPEVGHNFFDHMAIVQWWKLRHPERGQALGSPLWQDEAFRLGKPIDWIVFEQTPKDLLLEAFKRDGSNADPVVMDPNCVHSETLVVYCPTGGSTGMPKLPFDGTYISTAVLGLMPTSRGSITLASADPKDSPLIDPNFYAKEADRASLRYGVRQVMRMMLGTSEGKDMVQAEVTPADCSQLTLESTDAEIDDRIKSLGNSFYHAAGSLAMGKVVDTELRVKGVQRLRVVDASVVPVSIAAHYQVCVYALAEQAAQMILAASVNK
jgi:choline dehydrogenase-like flavoprotein